MERWIVVPNWEKFQHYSDRDPVWIKNYVALTADEDYLALSLHARGVLHGIWVEYARAHGQLLGSTSALSRRLGGRVTRATLNSLYHAGFIDVSASKPLAFARSRESTSYLREEKSASARARGGAREDAPGEKTPASVNGDKPRCPRCGLTTHSEERLQEHLENVHGEWVLT